jgi:PST family polysaccharide transporter
VSDLKYRTFGGVSWSAIGKVADQVIKLLIGVILARLLTPSDFGLVGMVVVFTGFARIFQSFGLGSALVHISDLTEAHLSTVFWFNLVMGVILTILYSSLAPLLASFYGDSILQPITVLLSLQFVFAGISVVHRSVLIRDIDFRLLSVVSVGSTVFAGTTAVVLAQLGYGVWSLVVKRLFDVGSAAGILWVSSSWRPQLGFSVTALKDLWQYSINLLGTKSLNFWTRRLDDVLIGRYIGSDALGTYSKAYQTMLVPLTNVSRVISRVMFPALSSIKDDVPRVRTTFLRMTRTIALLTFPAMVGLLVTVEPFVIGVFGAQWSGMIPVLSVLCVTGLWQSIGTLNGSLYMSQGRTDVQFRVSMVMNPVIMAGIIVGLYWGILGVAIGYTLASLINGYVNFNYAGSFVGLRYRDLVYHLSGIFGCAVLMGVGVYGVGYMLPSGWSHLEQLIVQVSAGVALYWALVYSCDVRAYRDTVDLVLDQWRQRNRA